MHPQPSLGHAAWAGSVLGTLPYNQRCPPTSGTPAAAKYTRTIAGQAELLSTELYTHLAHFILELVQNADDCNYDPDVQPQLLLLLLPDALLCATNEVGFTEANVEAICDMAQSTKSRRTGPFTGEKGACQACGPSTGTDTDNRAHILHVTMYLFTTLLSYYDHTMY